MTGKAGIAGFRPGSNLRFQHLSIVEMPNGYEIRHQNEYHAHFVHRHDAVHYARLVASMVELSLRNSTTLRVKPKGKDPVLRLAK